MTEKHDEPVQNDAGLPALLTRLRPLIRSASQKVFRNVDVIQGSCLLEIRRHNCRIREGRGRLEVLAGDLTVEFGKGFDASNLRYMRLFINHFNLRRTASRIELDTVNQSWWQKQPIRVGKG